MAGPCCRRSKKTTRTISITSDAARDDRGLRLCGGEDGAEGVSLALTNLPDLILADHERMGGGATVGRRAEHARHLSSMSLLSRALSRIASMTEMPRDGATTFGDLV